jgi:hypothetical protein
MTDIVERLREFSGKKYSDDICGKTAMAEAAAEITRLRRENSVLLKAADDVYAKLMPTVEGLIAEANGHELLSNFCLTAIVQISQFAKQKGATVEQLGLFADTAIAKIAEKN